MKSTRRLIHIATVGRLLGITDDPSQISDPISFTVHQEKVSPNRAGRYPDYLYLLYTIQPVDSRGAGSKPTLELLQKKWEQHNISVIPVEVHPFNVEAIGQEITRILETEHQTGAKIVVNFTSGTGPMQAAAFTKAVDFQLLKGSAVDLEIVYVQEFKEERPEDPTQRGTASTMQLLSVSPLQLYYDHLFKRGLELFRAFDYERALAYFDEAARLISHEPVFQARAQDYARLCQAYIFWEQFSYGAALQELRSLTGYLNDSELEQYVEAKKNYLEPLMGKPERPPQFFYVADMLERAVRDLRRGRKHDVALKLFRFFEMLLEWRLGQAYKFFVDPAQDNAEAKTRWQSVATCYYQKIFEKAARLSYTQVDAERDLQAFRRQERYYYVADLQMILECLEDPICQKIKEELEALSLTLLELRDLRNQSPLMHGYRGIDVEKGAFKGEQTIRKLISIGYQLIEFLIEQEELNAEEWKTLQVVLRPYPYDPLTIWGE